jgi:hypothetical protein
LSNTDNPSAAGGPAILFCVSGHPEKQSLHHFMPAIWLKSHGWNVRCLCLASDREPMLHTPLADLPVERWTGTGVWGHARFAAQLAAARGRTDVFYLYSHVVAPAAYFSLAGVPSVRIVYHTQDYLHPGRHPHWEFFERHACRRACLVISNESERARHLAGQYNLRRIPEVVRTFLPSAWPVPEHDGELRRSLLSPAASGNACLVMAGGPFSPTRCGPALLTAFRTLPDHFRLVFTVRDVSDRRLTAERVAEAGLSDRTVVVTGLDNREFLRHVAACDVGLLLYPNDGIGNYHQAPGRLTEYISCGVPVVASGFPGLRALVDTHSLGTTCDPASPESIAAAIRTVASADRNERPARSARLKRLSRSEFSYDSEGAKLETLLRNVVSGDLK